MVLKAKIGLQIHWVSGIEIVLCAVWFGLFWLLCSCLPSSTATFPFVPVSIKSAPPHSNLQLQLVVSFFLIQRSPSLYPSVTMVIEGLDTALADAIRDI